MTIFVSTAYLDEAERCGRIGLMHEGRLLACDTVAGVKQLMKGTLLELRCPETRRACGLLRSAQVGPVALFGDKLHILVEDADRGRLAVEAALLAASIPCLELRVTEPSLEDVFMSALPGEKR